MNVSCSLKPVLFWYGTSNTYNFLYVNKISNEIILLCMTHDCYIIILLILVVILLLHVQTFHQALS
jgi:hypothetical protein